MEFESIKLKWTDYIPHKPTPKQMGFLLLPHREAFFGGAAGGGKSDALLMGALQYVDVPGYASLLLRKTLSDLKLPGALLDRARSWLGNTDAYYAAGEHTWYFPTVNPVTKEPDEPAKLTFGYIGESNAFTRYQGIELQYVGYDELTQHWEDDYRYLFSRLRKNICSLHTERDDNGDPIYHEDCPLCQQQRHMPLRMRGASNPGGVGHGWVRDRFQIGPDKTSKDMDRPTFIGRDPKRPFIPSFISDNPHLAQKEYEEGLSELDTVTREQLKHGNWGISANSRFKKEQCRYYSCRGDHYILGRLGHGRPIYRHQPSGHSSNNAFKRIFITVDPAASTREGPGDADIWRKMPSHTVISTWGLTEDFHLLWLWMTRIREEIPEVIEAIIADYRKWRPEYVCIESVGLGIGVFQTVQRKGLPVKPIKKHTDKLVNSTDAVLRMKQGRIWLPEEAPWLETCEAELFTWTGHPQEQDDIVDTLADAAKDISWEAVGAEEVLDPNDEGLLTRDDLPGVIGGLNHG